MQPHISLLPADAPVLEREVRVMRWVEQEDGISTEAVSSYYSESSWLKMSDSDIAKLTSSTRLGGIPCWIQSPKESPKDGWRFVGQLDSVYSFLTTPQKADPRIDIDQSHWEGRTHVAQGPNFGDGGIAYLFFREVDSTPQGWMFWQCG